MGNLANGKRNKITILHAASHTDNGQGGKLPNYTPFAEAWAKVDEEPGSESYFAGQTYGVGKARFTVRYLPGVTRAMLVQFGSKQYKIEGVRDKQVGWNREIELLCNEYQPKGSV